jgi:hypothetical protein
MTKIRSLLAAALILLPAVALNAGPLPSAETRPGLSSPQPAGGMCWVWMANRWWYVPC